MSAIESRFPIETERLFLRLPAPEEADVMTAYRVENREHLAPWEPQRSPEFYTVSYWEKQIRHMHAELFQGHSLRLSMFLKEKPRGPVIGVINFTQVMRGVFQSCYLGYGIDHRYEGRGCMYEGLKAALEYVFTHFEMHRIQANYMPRNERSGRLLKKLGFTVEGYARDYLKIAGQWEDHILAAKIR